MDDQLQQAANVKILVDIVYDAWCRCIWDYFQLVTLRLVDPLSAQSYIESCLHDSVEFNNFTHQLTSQEFRNTQVWRAWNYIRELITKYKPGDPRIQRLDKGARESKRYKLGKFLAGSPLRATILMDRPDRIVTLSEWNRFPQHSLNALLDEATEMCGREVLERMNWEYTDVFADQSPRLTAIFG
jgi:hypothetical protein